MSENTKRKPKILRRILAFTLTTLKIRSKIHGTAVSIKSRTREKLSHTNSKVKPSNQVADPFCDICMDTKTESEMFRNTKVCKHMFCFDCIRGHVAARIQENITKVRCPDPKCKGVIGLEACRFIIPIEVLERWEDALCESLILGTQKFYCPFTDCSALLVNDGRRTVTSSECPHCNRLFCAQCKVTWHSGMSCSKFQSLKKGEKDNDIKLINLAKKKKWNRCPNCHFYVEKINGCNSVICRCGRNFDYGKTYPSEDQRSLSTFCTTGSSLSTIGHGFNNNGNSIRQEIYPCPLQDFNYNGNSIGEGFDPYPLRRSLSTYGRIESSLSTFSEDRVVTVEDAIGAQLS